eukprot:TRINITY_DN9454_c0_g2_i1.p1 TRINITY_DN9454_c0_g2~~TRINITY_DN9454_c0_g2_i1.p1  ORF type:complete len:629 (+),score=121.84 TRINITY_DN9454_c0_g2_i1:70-1956(+)
MVPPQWFLGWMTVVGESADERTRKHAVWPFYCVSGFVSFAWLLCSVVKQDIDGGSAASRAGHALHLISSVVFASSLFPALAYVLSTRSVPRAVCEYPVAACAVGVVLLDTGNLLVCSSSVVLFNVVLLDYLLLCDCSKSVTTFVVCVSVIGILTRAALEWEVAPSDDVCAGGPARLSYVHIRGVIDSLMVRMAVLLIDFHFTRGFAKSVREQSALVKQSVELSEIAAVRLSKFETEEAKALLEGPEGAQLPSGLRTALLQLVANLAQFRPYVPQSCLPSVGAPDEATAGDEPPATGGGPLLREGSAGQADSSSSAASSRSRHSGSHSQTSSDPNDRGGLRGLIPGETKPKRVSMVAANSKAFLRLVRDRATAVRCFLQAEVEAFVGEVVAESGVVDLVSGDHMYANFNAARTCTTHKVSAARVAWSLVIAKAAAGRRRSQTRQGRPPTRRSACACSGSVLCGNFGTTDVRRYMLLGSMYSTMQCLERVAAQLDMALVDENVGADADVGSSFFPVLVERLYYAKRGPKPFLVWQLAGKRVIADRPDDWMYELERQSLNPFESWNRRLHEWLNFGRPLAESELLGRKPFAHSAGVKAAREQSHLVEATVIGGTLAVNSLQGESDVRVMEL